jgi:hypothetical protein
MPHLPDEDLPPEGWEPTADDLALLGEDPRIKLDADLGTKADEDRGLARAAHDQEEAGRRDAMLHALAALQREIRAENARARAETQELAARIAKLTAEEVVASNLPRVAALETCVAALETSFLTPVAPIYPDAYLPTIAINAPKMASALYPNVSVAVRRNRYSQGIMTFAFDPRLEPLVEEDVSALPPVHGTRAK